MEFTLLFLRLLLWILWRISPLLILLATIVLALGIWVSRQEGWKLFDGIYWSFISASTVGYGDLVPGRRRSRIASVMVVVCGLVFSGLLVAAVVSSASLALGKTVKKVPGQIGELYEQQQSTESVKRDV